MNKFGLIFLLVVLILAAISLVRSKWFDKQVRRLTGEEPNTADEYTTRAIAVEKAKAEVAASLKAKIVATQKETEELNKVKID